MALRRTRLQLRTAVRANLDEASPSFWTNDNLNQFLNTSKDRVWQEVRKAKQGYFDVTRTSLDGAITVVGEAYDCTFFRTVAGTRDYALPHDFGALQEARCLTAGFEWVRLAFRLPTTPDYREASEDTTRRIPQFYTLLCERTWRLVPTPESTLDWALTYTAIVPDLDADGTTLEMPHPLYRAVQEYATAEALMMDRSPDAAAWEAKGNASIALFLGAPERQQTDAEHVTGFLEEW